MKWATLIIVSLAIVVASQPVASTGGQPEDRYGQIIDHRIAQCDRKALLTAARGPNLQAYGQKALDQATFYRNQRSSLVEGRYGQIIDHRIAQCDRKALLTAARGPNLQAYGQKALDQAAFYRNQRYSLVRQMISLGVEPKDYKVQYFLICSYCNPKQLKVATHLSAIE